MAQECRREPFPHDLAGDSHETTNLFANAQYAAVRSALLAQIAVLKSGAPPDYFVFP